MSLAKRILFGDDPAHDGIRRRMSEAAGQHIAEFPFAIPTRRKNRLEGGHFWDPFWRSSLSAAAVELGIETILVNSKLCARTKQEADAIRNRAEAIHQQKIAVWKRRSRRKRLDLEALRPAKAGPARG
jgi:hypothetical protein